MNITPKKQESSEMYYKPPLYFFNNLHRISVNVVGAGGTGSLVVSRLARINLVLQDMGYKGLYVTLIDDDIVEPHNVGRQMFTAYDVGRPKAEVLIEKINGAFSIDWKSCVKKYGWFQSRCNVIISCVDNVDCRKEIKENFEDEDQQDQRLKKELWFDCGNGKSFGQVVMSNINKDLPDIFDLNPDLSDDSDDEDVQGLGCSVWDSLHSQALFVNDDISVILAQMFWDLLKDKKIDYHASYSNIETGGRTRAFIKNL